MVPFLVVAAIVGADVVSVDTGAAVVSVDTCAVVVVVSGGVGETVTGAPVAEGGVELGGKVGIGIMEVMIEGKSVVVGARGEKDPQSVVHS